MLFNTDAVTIFTTHLSALVWTSQELSSHVKLEPNTILAALVAFGLVLGLGYLVQARRWHVGEGSKMRRKQLFLMSDTEERASGPQGTLSIFRVEFSVQYQFSVTKLSKFKALAFLYSKLRPDRPRGQ